MKNNYLKQLFTALLLLCATVAAAHDFEVNGIYYKISSSTNKTVEVTYKGTSYSQYSDRYTGSVVIPESVTYNGSIYSVTSIGGRAFYNCTGLTSITIPNSVTSIGVYSFNNCTGLTSIEIPNSVTSIGNYAFDGCTGLTNVVIGDGVTSIEKYAFCNCTGLISITIPNSVTSIGDQAFRGTAWYDNQPDGVVYAGKVLYGYKGTMPSNTSITIKEGTLGIAGSAFYNCRSLTSITIPNSVTSIGEKAFGYCTGLTSITIPNSVTSIGDSAFSGCTGLTSVVIGNSVTSIGNWAFAYCSGLTSITIPNSVTSIGDLAFNDCNRLTNVEIGNSVTSIGYNAFYSCTGLTSITIPNSVTSIGEKAFHSCKGLTNITVAAGNAKYDSRDNCNAIIETETNTLIAGCKNTIIPNSVTSIGNYAFEYCTRLTSITIPNSVTSIGYNAFSHCDGLTSITIPNSVTSIGQEAFYCCYGLTSVEFNAENCTSMGSSSWPVFSSCSALSTVTIGENVKNIPDYAFNGCTGLTEIFSNILAEDLFIPGSSAFAEVNKKACTLYVPAGAKSKYASTDGWKDFTNIVELEPTEVVTEVTITIGQYGSTVYSSPYALDFSDVEGLKAYAATGYKTNSQIITLTRVQTAEAGIGVFLKGEPGEYIVPVIESTDEHSLNMLVATLEKTEVNSTSSDGLYANFKYTIKSGDATPLFYRFADGSTLSAGKAYLQIPLAWLPATASKAINIRFDESETTDIDELKGENGKAKTIYDLSGRAVENPASGIYIIDGKKVYVK